MGSIELFLSGEETFTPGPSAPQNPTGAPPAPITLLSHQGLIAKDEEDDDLLSLFHSQQHSAHLHTIV